MTLSLNIKNTHTNSEKPNVGNTLDQAVIFLNKLNSHTPRKANPVLELKPQTKTKWDNTPAETQEAVLFIPNGVDLFLGANNDLFVRGIRGSLVHKFEKNVSLVLGLRSLTIVVVKNKNIGFLRTQVSLMYSLFVGVTKGYKEKIKTAGVGYRGDVEDTQLLTLSLGYSHKVQQLFHPTIETQFNRKNNRINFSAPSRPLLTGTVASLYHLKKPDVYNGKGIRYRGAKLRKKEGKKQGR